MPCLKRVSTFLFKRELDWVTFLIGGVLIRVIRGCPKRTASTYPANRKDKFIEFRFLLFRYSGN